MWLSVILTLSTIIITLIINQLVKRFLHKYARRKNLGVKRVYYIGKVFHFFFYVIALVVLLFIWSVDFKGVSVFASSLFAITGVALFAQWSLLSNITASLVIFFNFPARVGDKIRIMDKDDTVEGSIKEITLFQVELIDKEGNRIFYPNNLLLQRPVQKLA